MGWTAVPDGLYCKGHNGNQSILFAMMRMVSRLSELIHFPQNSHFKAFRKWPKCFTGTDFSASNHQGGPHWWSIWVFMSTKLQTQCEEENVKIVFQLFVLNRIDWYEAGAVGCKMPAGDCQFFSSVPLFHLAQSCKKSDDTLVRSVGSQQWFTTCSNGEYYFANWGSISKFQQKFFVYTFVRWGFIKIIFF